MRTINNTRKPSESPQEVLGSPLGSLKEATRKPQGSSLMYLTELEIVGEYYLYTGLNKEIDKFDSVFIVW